MRTLSVIAFAMLLQSNIAIPMKSQSEALQGALPERLSDTGLFEPNTAHARSGLIAFSPQYPLWSDGATKRRWLYLPQGTAIDASNPDAWEFPRGTKLWKEFSQGRAIETRYIERMTDGTWRFGTYVWNSQGTDAVLAPTIGVTAIATATNTRYDIPGEADCRACHEGSAVPVLGFSLLQLSSDRDPMAPHADITTESIADLRTLAARGLIKNLPASYLASPPRIPANSPVERTALGYLHGNCGHCHNDVGSLAALELSLAQTQSSSTSSTLASLIQSSRFRSAGINQRIVPGDAAASALVMRMRSRNPLSQMPPLGTNAIDAEAIALIERWINQDLPQNSFVTGAHHESIH